MKEINIEEVNSLKIIIEPENGEKIEYYLTEKNCLAKIIEWEKMLSKNKKEGIINIEFIYFLTDKTSITRIYKNVKLQDELKSIPLFKLNKGYVKKI